MSKTCVMCQTAKSEQDFNKCKTGRLGLHNHCRPCQKDCRRQWYLENREEELKKANAFQKTEKAKKQRAARWILSKSVLGPKNNERRKTDAAKKKARIQRKKWLQNPKNKIAQNMRGRIRKALKLNRVKNLLGLVGCDIFSLKLHLEQNFGPGMNWDNYGKWHVDHIVPCAKFNMATPEEREKAFHFSNLQPLWAKENQSKGSK